MTDDGSIPAARAAPPPGGGWQVSAGTARGAAHQASGLPNQDAVAYRDAGGPGGAVIVAIADGHGHSRHFRSGSGSALAVDTACRAAAAVAAGLTARAGHAALSRSDVDAAAQGQLAPALVRDWRAAVAAHLAGQPFTPQEQARLEAAGDEPEIPYGATLLVVTVLGPWLICAQIGDGDMLAIQPDGQSFSPVPTREKLGGERTRSLCQPDALAAFRVAVFDLDAQPLAALLLATDGYGNAQTADPWQPGVGRDLARFAGEHDHDWFGRQVPGWAERCASAEGSADDTTIAVLTHPAAVAPAGSRPLAGPSTETLDLGPRRDLAPDRGAGPSTETLDLGPGRDLAPGRGAGPPAETIELDQSGPPAETLDLGRSGRGGGHPMTGIRSSRRTVVLVAGAIALAALAAVIVVLLALRSSPDSGPARHLQPAGPASAAAGPRPGAGAAAPRGTNGTGATSGAGPDGQQAKASGPAGTQDEGDR